MTDRWSLLLFVAGAAAAEGILFRCVRGVYHNAITQGNSVFPNNFQLRQRRVYDSRLFVPGTTESLWGVDKL